MSFRRFILAITVALAVAFSANVASSTANAGGCPPGGSGGYC
jgi:hypothetical protein